jgi:hypothetical protein
LHRLRPVAGVTHDLEPVVRRKDRFEGLSKQTMVIRDENTDPFWHVDGSLHDAVPTSNLNCYGRFVKGDEARVRIQKLLVTGDNRLKQGVDPAKVRQSYEQALEEAREAGIEEGIRPLVEIRLADLERLAGESPLPSPPDA